MHTIYYTSNQIPNLACHQLVNSTLLLKVYKCLDIGFLSQTLQPPQKYTFKLYYDDGFRIIQKKSFYKLMPNAHHYLHLFHFSIPNSNVAFEFPRNYHFLLVNNVRVDIFLKSTLVNLEFFL